MQTKKSNTAQRLKEIMDSDRLRQVDILQKALPYCRQYGIKLSRSDLSQYVSGRTEPGQYKLSILGLALGVSEAWLMGYDVPKERIKKEQSLEDSVLNIVRHLNQRGQEEFVRYGKYLMSQDVYQSNAE